MIIDSFNTKPVFSLDLILSYLENTTEDSWCTDVVKTKAGKSCLFGHLFDLGGGELWDWFENIATTYMIYPVNDGENVNYQQPTPKQRCIAYLKDLQSGKEKTTYQIMEEFENSFIKEDKKYELHNTK
jgi:hypothetical protein